MKWSLPFAAVAGFAIFAMRGLFDSGANKVGVSFLGAITLMLTLIGVLVLYAGFAWGMGSYIKEALPALRTNSRLTKSDVLILAKSLVGAFLYSAAVAWFVTRILALESRHGLVTGPDSSWSVYLGSFFAIVVYMFLLPACIPIRGRKTEERMEDF